MSSKHWNAWRVCCGGNDPDQKVLVMKEFLLDAGVHAGSVQTSRLRIYVLDALMHSAKTPSSPAPSGQGNEMCAKGATQN